MKSIYVLSALGLILVASAVIIGQQSGSVAGVTTSEPIRIGVSTILTSDWAALGDNIVKSAQLAVDKVNAEGGINGRRLMLYVEDAGLDSKTGLSAAQKLVNVDGVKYIIGGTSSNGTLAAAPLVNESKVVYMTPVTGGKNVDEAGEYVFRMANGDTLAGRDLARAATKLGFTRAAVVSEVTEYTLDIKKSFDQSFAGTVVLSEEFQPGATDFRTIVAKARSSSPDVLIVLSQTGIAGAHFVKQVREAGIIAPVMTDFTFVSNANAKEIMGSFDGVYFADPAYAPKSDATKAVFAAFEAKYGTKPFIPFHTAATYDSVMLLAQAISEVGDDSEKVRDWLLTHVQNYSGLMGTYSLDREGNSDLGFVLKRVVGDSTEVVR